MAGQCQTGSPDNSTFKRIPTKQKRRSTGQGAKKPLEPQRPEKTWVPAGASGHELSRPKRVSWLPAYGRMSAMSIPVSCVGVKTHVFMNDFPTKHKRRSPGPGEKKPLDPQRPEKIWVPAGASGHKLSRPKRVSWLPVYGRMSAMSIPVSCVGVKTHVCMDDLVVKF